MSQPQLRQSYAQLLASVQRLEAENQQFRQAVSQNATYLSAVISLLGEQSVRDEVQRLAQERQEKEEAALDAGVQKLVEAKVITPTEAIGEGTLVVGRDIYQDGTSRRVQFEDAQIPAEVKEKFLGKKAGETIENNGAKLTVSAVYTIDRARVEEFQAEEKAKALAAQAAAEQPAAPAAQ